MSSQIEGVYRAWLENPLDETPRMMYADCLDDHGYAARAKFFRDDWVPNLRRDWQDWLDTEAANYWHPSQEIFCGECRGRGFLRTGPCLDCGGSLEIDEAGEKWATEGTGFMPRPFKFDPDHGPSFMPIVELVLTTPPAISYSMVPRSPRNFHVWIEDGRPELNRSLSIPEHLYVNYGRRSRPTDALPVVSLPVLFAKHWPGIRASLSFGARVMSEQEAAVERRLRSPTQ